MSRYWCAPQCVLTAALFLALAVYAWRGAYTRYLMDDYCTAGSAANDGLTFRDATIAAAGASAS